MQAGQLFIFPKPESRFATAKVKLPHHGLHGAEEETGERFAFKLTRKSKVTLYLKVRNRPLCLVGANERIDRFPTPTYGSH